MQLNPSTVERLIMSDRPAKLRRLNQLRRQLPHATASAFAAIVSAVHDETLPDAFSRKALRQARDLEATRETPFGPVHQTVELCAASGDATRVVHVAHPPWRCYGLAYLIVSPSPPSSTLDYKLTRLRLRTRGALSSTRTRSRPETR